MQACPECGRESPDGFLFCGFCAAPLTGPSSARRRLATLVFCDLVGSTALGERVDPESVQELLQRYFGEMRAALERHGGVVEKFIGDAVVGVFGVPVAREDDALRACRAALEMQGRLHALHEELRERIEVRIGVNSGEVVGSRETFVTGDAVNVAARLEQAARPGEVLLGETTWRLVRDAARVAEIEPLGAKGKSAPLRAYRLLEVAGRDAVAGWAGSLVGRSGELARLEREFELAVAERVLRRATVVGEPGVGKSRLAAELARRIEARARVVRGGCLSYGEGITFWAVAQIVRDLAGIHDEHSAAEARAKIDGMVREAEGREAVSTRVAQLLGLAEGAATGDQLARAVAAFLAAAAGEQPLVLLVDDIHWAEPALLDLLGELPALLDDAPILLLCLARPELLESRPDWPAAVRLGPLDAAETDELLEQLEAPAAVRVRLAHIAAGNPLYAEELVAWVREYGELNEMPTTLNALLSARLDRLEARERDALERGAVEGELFHQEAIVELSAELARPAVPAELGQLARKDLIRLAAASLVGGGVAYRFKHILVRDAAYRATSKRLRASLHEQFADWLERLAGERMAEYQEILGYHFEQAYRYRMELGAAGEDTRTLAERAAHHLSAAGERANDHGDVRAAANLLGRATALLPADSVERLTLLPRYAYAVNETGRPLDEKKIWQELYERATAIGDRGLAVHARSALCRVLSDPNVDLDEARALAEEGIAIYTKLGDEARLALANRWLANVFRVQGRQAEAAACLERAVRHANVGGDLVTRRIATQSLALVLENGPVPVNEAIRRCEELRADNHDDRVLEAVIARCLSALLAMAARFDEAREYGSRSDRVLEEANLATSSRVTQNVAAHAKELAGDRVGAIRDLEARWRSLRHPLGRTPYRDGMETAYQLAQLYCDAGRWDDAGDCHAYYRDVPDPTHLITTAIRLAGAGRLAAHRGALDEAAALAQRAVEFADRTDRPNERARIWRALAEVQETAGRTDEAGAAVTTALGLYRQKGNIAAAAALAPLAT